MIPARVLGLTALCLVLVVTSRLMAQKVTLGEFHWVSPENAEDEAPVWKKPPKFFYPERLKGAPQTGYAIIEWGFAADGKLLFRNTRATDPLFKEAIEWAPAPKDGYRVTPARKNGRPVASAVWTCVIFHAAGSAPRLLDVAPVPVPPQENGENQALPRTVTQISISADGSHALESLEGDELTEQQKHAVETAVARWRFAASSPGAFTVRLPVLFMRFRRSVDPNPNPVTPPKQIRPPASKEPFFTRLNVQYDVQLKLKIDEKGKVRSASVVRSNNPAFDQAAIEAALQWSFEPGRRDGQPVPMDWQIRWQNPPPPGVWSPLDPTRAIEVSTVDETDRKNMQNLPPELQYDLPPQIKGVVRPVYPYELLAKKAAGDATIDMLVGRSGRVLETTVIKASDPAFAKAVQAMLDVCEFEPARRAGEAVPAVLRIEQTFQLSAGSDAFPGDSALQLLRQERSEKSHIFTVSQLDAQPRPRSQRAPVYPFELRKTATEGQAVVEFLVDKDGWVRLPRIKSATREEFGYAAVQAVSQWLFEPPTKNGKSVVARVAVPVVFKLTGQTK